VKAGNKKLTPRPSIDESEGRGKKVDAQGRAIDEVKAARRKLMPRPCDRRSQAGKKKVDAQGRAIDE